MILSAVNIEETITVELKGRSYRIEIGAGVIDTIGDAVAEIAPGAKCAIICDDNVERQHGDRLRANLDASGISHETICVPHGEGSKSYDQLGQVVDQLLAMRLERNDLVLALGGGVVGDLAGFAAAIVRRGMRYIQVPTSLLAQVDSSVGGKTGINSPHGKNLIGAFHQPARVLADLDILKTLPAREFRAGYAEVAKYGLLGDAAFFEWLEANHFEIFDFGPALAKAIAASCRMKAEIVARDETETGDRALLNLGHTFGHALEGYAGYDGKRLVHGEAVSIGMVLAHEFSNRMNLCSSDDVARVRSHLSAVKLPVKIADIPGDKPDAEQLMQFIAQDKKVSRGSLTFILTKGIGNAYIARDVPGAEVSAFLAEKLA